MDKSTEQFMEELTTQIQQLQCVGWVYKNIGPKSPLIDIEKKLGTCKNPKSVCKAFSHIPIYVVP